MTVRYKTGAVINCRTLRRVISVYLSARSSVVGKGFGNEIDWQESRDIDMLTEAEFLREAAWVILSSGMRESIVRKYFPEISTAFFNWVSASKIIARKSYCRKSALALFNHKGKVDAILSLCEKVHRRGFKSVLSLIRAEGVEYLTTFDFLGPVTSVHLAKNIGLDCVKPDRHLVRIAKATNFHTPNELCRAISEFTGDKLCVVDLVLWRFATLNRRYLSFFQTAICD